MQKKMYILENKVGIFKNKLTNSNAKDITQNNI